MDEEKKETKSKEEIKKDSFMKLYAAFQKALAPCDPLDYQVRQRNLLVHLADFVIINAEEFHDENKSA